MTKRAVAAAWVVLCCAAVAGGVAQSAEAIPAESKFTISYTMATPAPAAPLDIGDGRELTTNHYLITAYNEEGRGFLHLTAGECVNIRFAVRGKRTIDTHAYCHFKDRDGDELFAEYATGAPKPTRAITINWTFMSGTGKYDGIAGSAEATNSNNLDDQGAFQGVGKMVGSYKITAPAATGAVGRHD